MHELPTTRPPASPRKAPNSPRLMKAWKRAPEGLLCGPPSAPLLPSCPPQQSRARRLQGQPLRPLEVAERQGGLLVQGHRDPSEGPKGHLCACCHLPNSGVLLGMHRRSLTASVHSQLLCKPRGRQHCQRLGVGFCCPVGQCPPPPLLAKQQGGGERNHYALREGICIGG